LGQRVACCMNSRNRAVGTSVGLMEPGSQTREMHELMDTGSWNIISVHRARKLEYPMHEFMELVGWDISLIHGVGQLGQRDA
jgi:hypothetical protein